MMMKQQDSTAINAVYCGQCGVDARPFLHHLRHRGNFRRLCTTCVLRLNSQSFCPTCFLIYESRPAPIPLPDSVSCFKCYSSSHSSCVGPNPSNPYICPLCTNPNSPIFNIKNKEIDKKAASVLLAAAKIAANSMNKAAAGAKAEAEKRVKEAAIARKKAKEAMEHLASIETKDKLLNMNMGLGSVEVLGSGNCRSGIVNKIVTNVGERNLFGDRNRMDRVDSSSAVLAALNAVELREKEKLVVVKSENVVSGGGRSDVALMEVDENVQNNGTGNEKKSGDLGHELVPVLNVEPIAVLNVDQQLYVQKDHAREGNGDLQQ